MSGKKGKGRQAQRMQELEIKKRSGMLQAVAAFVIMVVLIFIKTTFSASGAEWANAFATNAIIFIAALVAAGFAGYGTQRWNRARKELDRLKAKRK